ncbi:MAG: bifunctional nuclease family protein [Planctomycetes bacterium]|nr:bifunctional nuclease family protein [Planctomycetota bacterium]
MSGKNGDERLLEMQLRRVVIRENSDHQYIYLVEKDGERSFPIVIGTTEAFEIRRVVCGVQTERPLTHQLAHELIESLGGRLVGVDIVDLRNNTFYAKLLVEQSEGGEQKVVDTRPSDAVALALRAGCPLRVAESVLAEARDDMSKDDLGHDSPPEDNKRKDEDATE